MVSRAVAVLMVLALGISGARAEYCVDNYNVTVPLVNPDGLPLEVTGLFITKLTNAQLVRVAPMILCPRVSIAVRWLMAHWNPGTLCTSSKDPRLAEQLCPYMHDKGSSRTKVAYTLFTSSCPPLYATRPYV